MWGLRSGIVVPLYRVRCVCVMRVSFFWKKLFLFFNWWLPNLVFAASSCGLWQPPYLSFQLRKKFKEKKTIWGIRNNEYNWQFDFWIVDASRGYILNCHFQLVGTNCAMRRCLTSVCDERCWRILRLLRLGDIFCVEAGNRHLPVGPSDVEECFRDEY